MPDYDEQSNWIDGKWIDPNPCQWWIDPPRCVEKPYRPGKRARVFHPRTPGESDEEYTLRMMVEAATKQQDILLAEEIAKKRQTDVLEVNRRVMEINRYFNPSTEAMPIEVKGELEERGVLRKAMAGERRRQRREEARRQTAMNVKMAKVRAAKRKR